MPKRISDEDGFNAGVRNYGRFCLSMIPWALGVGVLTWMAVYVWGHYISNDLSQERRAAVYTGAKTAPKSRIAVELSQGSCVKLERADLDGHTLYVYTKNNCGRNLGYLAYHWEELSPSGTVIHDGWTNLCPVPTEDGDTAECVFGGGMFGWLDSDSIDTDKRVDRIRVWVDGW